MKRRLRNPVVFIAFCLVLCEVTLDDVYDIVGVKSRSGGIFDESEGLFFIPSVLDTRSEVVQRLSLKEDDIASLSGGVVENNIT